MSYVKVVSKKATTITKFDDATASKKWLLKNGFFHANGAWKHLDGRQAGTYKDWDSAVIQKNCHKTVSKKNPLGRYNK